MRDERWVVGQLAYTDRMPPLPTSSLDERQRKVAEDLTNGPRGGVKGPFVPLLRSPDLVDRLGKLGEYLRFGSSLDARVSELVMLSVAREWTNQFEWATHAPLAFKAGIKQEVIDALSEGRRPRGMAEDEEIAYELCEELSRTKSVCETTYRRAAAQFGETRVIDLLTLYGYFVTVCAIMNVGHTPPPPNGPVAPLMPFPL